MVFAVLDQTKANYDAASASVGAAVANVTQARAAIQQKAAAVTVGYNSTGLSLIDLASGHMAQQIPIAHTWNGIAFSLDGKRILSASLDKTLRYWNVETGECIHTLEGHYESVDACAISPDGRLIGQDLHFDRIVRDDNRRNGPLGKHAP